jgi:hypothetical protein
MWCPFSLSRKLEMLQQFSLKSSKICCLFFCKNQNSFCFSEKFRKNKALFCKNSTFFSGSVRPRQHGEGRLLRLAHFHCAFCSPPPQVHRVRGGGGLFQKSPGNIGGHQVCSPPTMSSLWKVVHLEQHHQVPPGM